MVRGIGTTRVTYALPSAPMTLESFRWISSPAAAAGAKAAASKASAYKIFMEFPEQDDGMQHTGKFRG